MANPRKNMVTTILHIANVAALFGMSYLFSKGKGLSSNEIDIVVFLSLLMSSACAWAMYQPWKIKKISNKELTMSIVDLLRSRHILVLAVCGMLLYSFIRFFCSGLGRIGILRTIVLSAISDHIVFLPLLVGISIPGKTISPKRSNSANHVKGSFLILGSMSVLLITSDPNESQIWYLHPLSQLIIAFTVMLFYRRLHRVAIKTHVGHYERLYCFTLAVSAIISLLVMFFNLNVEETILEYRRIIFATLPTTAMSTLSFYLEKLDNKSPAKPYSTIFGAAFALQVIFYPTFDIGASIAACLIFMGIQYHGNQSSTSLMHNSILPIYNPSSGQTARSQLFTMKKMFSHVLKDTNSRKIFIFMLINFGFMFVEIIVGCWSNSLGLISDAAHMLFDCLALAIGLYASYISNLRPNLVFTYGYRRYEVLAGFVNGVFLVFISFSVVIESIERIFHPPDIHTGQILVVSILGLFVNIIGLIFFHEAQ